MQQAFIAADWSSLAGTFAGMLQTPDIWLWLYLIFAISNTMLPSQTDREAWTPIMLFLALAVALAWFAGLGPAIVNRLGQPLDLATRWLTTVYAFTVVVDLPFVLLITLVERIMARVKGVRVEYSHWP
ncbi:MAG: hypothetical protein PVI63_00895 [Anaerolineae bacterium]